MYRDGIVGDSRCGRCAQAAQWVAVKRPGGVSKSSGVEGKGQLTAIVTVNVWRFVVWIGIATSDATKRYAMCEGVVDND